MWFRAPWQVQHLQSFGSNPFPVLANKKSLMSHNPTDGVRLLLELTSEDNLSAEYTGSIHTTESTFEYQIRLNSDGTATLENSGTVAPPDLEKKLTNIAKSVARAAARKKQDGLKPWPPRVLRWRR